MEQFGKYELLGSIGAGGMAEIWLAKERGLAGFERLVVLKRILATYNNEEKFIQMFLDEARLAAQLNHPNIVQIFDLGYEQGSYYIAMEFILGEDLEKIQAKIARINKKFPIIFACQIIAQAAEGLHYAHSLNDIYGHALNIVHRDISPQNILVSYSGTVKIVDFGIAKAKSQSNKTREGVIKGKFAYMSPENITGTPLDGRSDIFALGILLYELTLNQRLFSGDSEVQIIRKIADHPITSPLEIDDSYPEELNHIVMKALDKDRDQRYQEARDLRMDLENFLKSYTEFRALDATLGRWMHNLFAKEIKAFNTRKEAMLLATQDIQHDEFEGEDSAIRKIEQITAAPPPHLNDNGEKPIELIIKTEDSMKTPKQEQSESDVSSLVSYMGKLFETESSKPKLTSISNEDQEMEEMLQERFNNPVDETIITDNDQDEVSDFLQSRKKAPNSDLSIEEKNEDDDSVDAYFKEKRAQKDKIPHASFRVYAGFVVLIGIILYLLFSKYI